MKKLINIVKQNIVLVSFFIIISIWQLCGYFNLLPKFILPTPLEIIVAFISDFHLIISHSGITLLEAFLGLLVGVVLAIILAIISEVSPLLKKIIVSYAVVFQTIPIVAVAPLLVLWLGYDIEPKIVLVALTSLFPVVVSILEGFDSVDKDMVQLFNLMQARKLQVIWHLKIPQAIHYFYSGLKLSVSYAIVSALVAEWLGGFHGLGVYMMRVRKAFAYDKLFAVIVFVSIINLLLIKILDIIFKKCIPWEDKK